MDTASLLWGLIFGSIGFAYVMYGKKQRAPVAAIAGALLIVIPYVVDTPILLVAAGVGLMAIPWFVRL
ncbi:MAG TPA: amino acid transport protein [Moraxellaceae bacterium]|nr:amino acid transport protein [Moraxellaceae bacterium]